MNREVEMAYVSDRKFADDMGLTLEQVRKLIKRVDIAFFASGKGVEMVYMFDPEVLNLALIEQAKTKKDRKRGPRKTASIT